MSALLLAAVLAALHAGPPPDRPSSRLPPGGGAGGGSGARVLDDGGVRAAAVEAALAADARLVITALWSDRVPPGAAAALGGPALRALADAAAGRRRQGVRVRMLRSSRTVLSARAAAGGGADVVVRWRQELAPAALDGSALGRPLELDEEARLLLRRSPGSGRLVVWKVELLR